MIHPPDINIKVPENLRKAYSSDPEKLFHRVRKNEQIRRLGRGTAEKAEENKEIHRLTRQTQIMKIEERRPQI